MNRVLLWCAMAIAALTLGRIDPACAEPVRTPHVEAELVSSRSAFVPGEPLTVALRLSMQRGWHTYWRNPGDSGLPTSIEWKLPKGFSAGEIQWPTPRALPVGPLVNYGYEGEILLPVQISTPAVLDAGASVTLSARADWLVCKEICIPEGADLTLALPLASSGTARPSDTKWTTPIADAQAALPRPLVGWRVAAAAAGDVVRLTLSADGAGADPGTLRFFPFAEGRIEPAGAQIATREGGSVTLALPVARQRSGDFRTVAGVLTASNGFGGQRAVIVDAPLTGVLAAGTAASATGAGSSTTASSGLNAAANRVGAQPNASAQEGGTLSLALALVFALIGGVLLNLMPCVFPVLSLKVLGFATHAESRASMRLHGLAFAAGVIVSFWILAAALVAFRTAGTQLGWGFQLQSPVVVAALAILFFVLALNLSGVFEIRQLVPSSVAGWNARNAYVNDALSGVLAVVIASPCSAPFMGAALGYALAESALVTWATFTALGIGMALPYVLLAMFPGWRARLPKPGAWMVRLRQLLAFPLYASVLWLAWVLGAQLDNNAVARLGAVLLLVALALWAWQLRGNRASSAWIWKAGAVVALAGAALVGWPIVGESSAVASATAPSASTPTADAGRWQRFNADRVAQLAASGRPVFVDFTAAWCVTCQVNKQLVLNTDAMHEAFSRSGVTLVRADWTRRDAEIGAALAALGRNGVPVYVLYRPGKAPLLLPEVLQQRMILDALATL